MKKATKIAVIAVIVLVVVAVPFYFYMRQNVGTAEGVQITGAVSNPENLTISQIEAFSPVTVTVKVKSLNPLENGTFDYTGVPLKVLLEQAQISPNASSVFIQAPDGYAITLSIQEAQKANTIYSLSQRRRNNDGSFGWRRRACAAGYR